MNGYQIGAMVASSLTSRCFVMNVDGLSIEKRLTTIETFCLLLTNHALSGFRVVLYLVGLFVSLFKIILEIRIIRTGLPLNEDMPLNASIANAVEHHPRVFVHKTPLDYRDRPDDWPSSAGRARRRTWWDGFC